MDEMGCEYVHRILTVVKSCNRLIGCELNMIPTAPLFSNVTCENLLKNTSKLE
jgi:hypothetical protein